MKICIDRIIKRASMGHLLTSAILFILFMFTILPMAERWQKEPNPQAGNPDMSLIYSGEELYRIADAMGEVGRFRYIILRFTMDIPWPLIYGYFSLAAIALMLRGGKRGRFSEKLILLPVLAIIFDFLENTGALIIMARFPSHTHMLELLTPIFTFTKWIFVGSSMILALASLLILLFRFLNEKGKRDKA